MTDKTLGGYIRTTPHPNDMDGGVTAEQIEQEADTRTREHLLHEESRLLKLEESLRAHLSRTINRAEKAEKERDEALRTVQEAVDSHDETLRDIAAGKYAAESRPLTPDAISADAYERGVPVLRDACPNGFKLSIPAYEAVRAIVSAVLTEPFTDAARAEAVRAWHEDSRIGNGNPIADIGQHMAEWARTHLTAQEPTDAEVEAAKAVLDSVEYADEPQSIRAALCAARAARRDEE